MNNKSELSIFCENVKYFRAVNKLSKSEMAKKLGISVASLSSIENGNVPPRLSCDVIFLHTSQLRYPAFRHVCTVLGQIKPVCRKK